MVTPLVSPQDSNWRWTHKVGSVDNCYTGSLWNQTFCPDPATCTENCAIDGVDEKHYNSTYGVIATKDGVNITFVTNGTYGVNVGSRLYVMEDADHYKQFKLLNKEFTFDVDSANLPCGLNGAVYFVEMDSDGGKARYPTNTAGATLGTGYCDAQCPHDLYGERPIESRALAPRVAHPRARPPRPMPALG